MAVREKRVKSLEPASARRTIDGSSFPLGTTRRERRAQPALSHPRPGTYFLGPSLDPRRGCVLPDLMPTPHA
jgi:hypothetical protein